MGIDKKEFLERKHYEHELINRRLTWLLTSQSLLFAAYGLVYASNKLQDQVSKITHGIALVGMVIAGIIWVGIVAAIIASLYLWIDVKQKDPAVPLGVRTGTTLLGWIPDVFLPLVFIFAWWYLYKIA